MRALYLLAAIALMGMIVTAPVRPARVIVTTPEGVEQYLALQCGSRLYVLGERPMEGARCVLVN